VEDRVAGFDYLENTFGAIHSYCGWCDNPSIGQFVEAQKTSIISGLTFRGLRGTDGTALLVNLHSLLRAPDASSPNLSTSHGKETPDDDPENFHVAGQVWEVITACW
jgi:hypothetical protein